MLLTIAVSALAVGLWFLLGHGLLRAITPGAAGGPAVVAVVVGQISSVSLYAIAMTQGRTAMLPLLAVLGCAALVWRAHGEGKIAGPPRWSEAGELALVAMAVAALMGWPMFSEGLLLYQPVQQDNDHYTRVAAFLNATGAECAIGDLLTQQTCQRSPYHFFDAWNAALISRLGVPLPLAFAGVTSGALTAGLYAAYRYLAAQAGAGKYARLVAAVGLLGSLDFWLPRLNLGLLAYAEVFVSSLQVNNKMLPAALALALAACAWSSSAGFLVPLLLASAAIMHSTFAPFVGASLVLLLAHDWRRGHRARLQAGLLAVGALGLMAVWYLAESRLHGASELAYSLEPPGYAGSKAYFVRFAKVVFKTILQLGVLLLPYVALALLSGGERVRAWGRSSPVRLAAGLIGAGLLASLLVWASIHYRLDSVQPLSNVTSVLWPVLGVLLLAQSLEPGAPRPRVAQAALALALVASVAAFAMTLVSRVQYQHARPSREFLAGAQRLLQRKDPIGVRFQDASSLDIIWKKYLVLGSPAYLTAIRPDSCEAIVPVGEVPFSSDPKARYAEQALMYRGHFYRFAQKLTSTTANDPATIAAFVRETRPDHLICEGALSQAYCDPSACSGPEVLPRCPAGKVGPCVQDGQTTVCLVGDARLSPRSPVRGWFACRLLVRLSAAGSPVGCWFACRRCFLRARGLGCPSRTRPFSAFFTGIYTSEGLAPPLAHRSGKGAVGASEPAPRRPPCIPRRPPGVKGVRRFRIDANRSGIYPISPLAHACGAGPAGLVTR